MKFEELVHAVGTFVCFDLNTLRTLFPDHADSAPVQLYRWRRAGKVVELRRGIYALAEPYRKVPLHGPAVAGHIYHPSYLSLEWALSFHGLVPEKAGTFTSVTTRERRTFTNPLGRFTYRTVQPELFFGHSVRHIMGTEVRMATPEKALLDYWYLSTGEWTVSRMQAMRFDPSALENEDRLQSVVNSADRPRLRRALAAWKEYVQLESAYEEVGE